MENLITINNQHNSLDSLHQFLNKNSSFECTKTYDTWEQRLDANGQMAQCLVLKKSNFGTFLSVANPFTSRSAEIITFLAW